MIARGEIAEFLIILFLFEEIGQINITNDEERYEEEGPLHFEEDVEDGVEGCGDQEALYEILYGKDFLVIDSKNLLHHLWPNDCFLLTKDWCREVRYTIVVAHHSGEEDVNEGRKNRTEYEWQHEVLRPLMHPNVMEVHDVFRERKSERAENRELNDIINIMKLARAHRTNGDMFHKLFDDTNDGKCENDAERYAHETQWSDHVRREWLCITKGVNPWEKLPEVFIKKNRKDCRCTEEKCVEDYASSIGIFYVKNIPPHCGGNSC